jgi:multidrug efflux pump subunit AcrA (membrane-fusion protein)
METKPVAESTEKPVERHDDRALRRKLRVFLIVLLVIALVLAIWGVVARLHTRSKLSKRTVNDAEITVVTAKPELSGAGDELVLPGIVQAFIEAPIYARTNGYLKTWHTDIGSRVHKGDLLAEIDTPEVDRQLSQARADLATAQANLDLSLSTNERKSRSPPTPHRAAIGGAFSRIHSWMNWKPLQAKPIRA